MKAEFLIENLEKYLPLLSKSLPIHSQIPVLSNLLIETTKDGIFVYSTNLEIGIRVKVAGKVEEEGAVTVPGKQFIEAISSFPKDKVKISLKGENLSVSCRDDEITFRTIAKDEFPSIYEDKGEKIYEFGEGEVEQMFSGLLFSAAQDDYRPELSGVLFSQKEEGIDLVTTDGFRLSMKTIRNKKVLQEESVILPARLLSEVSAFHSGSIFMYMHKKANQVIFESEDITLVGRLIIGQFPNYAKVIPKGGKTTITVDSQELAQKLKVVSIFARDSANIVRLQIDDGKIKMLSKSASVGEGDVIVQVEQEGPNNEIAFNIKFVQDFLKSVTAKNISMQVSSSVEPALFKVEGMGDYIHVIMPVRIQD
ncbi:MAG TPA: DNA polymerase III subunit beta [Patescibacteria group bacterium]|nr:DNA polymerase III subunit beta [Patescibacteria group bacterium]